MEFPCGDYMERKYYCIGIARKAKVKAEDLTTLSKGLSSSQYTLVGDNNGIYIFTDKTVMSKYMKELKSEQNDTTVRYKALDMGCEMPSIKPSQLIEK